jgi:cyclic pyranopterin phosphate synthase
MDSDQPRAFSHLNAAGEAKMVNIGAKPEQRRRARAGAIVHCEMETIALLKSRALPKGDVLTVAKIAGIQAAKQTSMLIPLCHPLPLSGIEISFEVLAGEIRIEAAVETAARTGVEMEALTAASVAALSIYDMCKAVDKTMSIDGIRVLEKIKE